MDKPNTLQEAILIIESITQKINEMSAKSDSLEAENLTLRKKDEDCSVELFGVKSSLEAEQQNVVSLKKKLESAEADNTLLKSQLSELQVKFDALSQKDMDIETRASEMAAKIVGESGLQTPVEAPQGSEEEPSMEEIATLLKNANGREKARLMDKYGDKISAYLKK